MRDTITFILLLSGFLMTARENQKTSKRSITLDSLAISNGHIITKTTAISSHKKSELLEVTRMLIAESKNFPN